ncbi:MAG TPA: hypothetical protein VIM44_05855, partial [Rariglobus sp.]
MKAGSPLREAWRGLTAKTRWFVGGCAVLAVGLFVSQLLEIPQRSALRGSDNTFNYLWLRSLMVGGDWDFRDDLAVTNTLAPNVRDIAENVPVTPIGRVANKYGVGWSLVSAPFYLVADGLVAGGRALGVWTLERDGYNPVYQVCLQTGHFLLAGLSLLLAYRVMRRWCAREPAVLGVAMLWAASPLLYYQTSNLSMSHGVTFFAVVVCLYGLVRAESDPDKLWLWLLAGAGLGLAVITRFQTVVYGLLPAWMWLARARNDCDVRRLVWPALAVIAGALPLVALQLFAWKRVYGSWLVYSYGTEGERFFWLKPAVREVLFSANHGLFYWHPLLLAGLAGLVALAWRKGGLAWAGVAAVAVTVYVNAAWWCWWFGSSFGSRAFDGVLVFFMLGLAWAYERLPERAGRWLFAIGTACVGWNVVVLTLYRLAVISRNAAVTYPEMWRALGRLLT